MADATEKQSKWILGRALRTVGFLLSLVSCLPTHDMPISIGIALTGAALWGSGTFIPALGLVAGAKGDSW